MQVLSTNEISFAFCFALENRMIEEKCKQNPNSCWVKKAGRRRRNWLWEVKFWPLHCCRYPKLDGFSETLTGTSQVKCQKFVFLLLTFTFSLHLYVVQCQWFLFAHWEDFTLKKSKPKETAIRLIWSHRVGHAGFSAGCALGRKSWGNSLIPHKPPLQILSLALFPNQFLWVPYWS